MSDLQLRPRPAIVASEKRGRRPEQLRGARWGSLPHFVYTNSAWMTSHFIVARAPYRLPMGIRGAREAVVQPMFPVRGARELETVEL